MKKAIIIIVMSLLITGCKWHKGYTCYYGVYQNGIKIGEFTRQEGSKCYKIIDGEGSTSILEKEELNK